MALWVWQEIYQSVLVANRIVDENIRTWIDHYKKHGGPSWKEWQEARR
jgi:hypothetical protein